MKHAQRTQSSRRRHEAAAQRKKWLAWIEEQRRQLDEQNEKMRRMKEKDDAWKLEMEIEMQKRNLEIQMNFWKQVGCSLVELNDGSGRFRAEPKSPWWKFW